MPRDYYDVLGVARTADDGEIKKAFRRLARELHPDVNSHDPGAEEKFKEAAEAYEVLSDAERRATYDRYGHEGLRTGGYAPNFETFGSVADIFEAFFGGGAFGGGGASATGPVAAVPAQPLDPTDGGVHPYGVAMTSRQGVGPATVPVTWSHGRNGRITVRISCVGAGPARITDAGGGLVLGLAGCSQYAIYTAGPIPLKASDRSITLAVGTATRWRLAIYVS